MSRTITDPSSSPENNMERPLLIKIEEVGNPQEGCCRELDEDEESSPCCSCDEDCKMLVVLALYSLLLFACFNVSLSYTKEFIICSLAKDYHHFANPYEYCESAVIESIARYTHDVQYSMLVDAETKYQVYQCLRTNVFNSGFFLAWGADFKCDNSVEATTLYEDFLNAGIYFRQYPLNPSPGVHLRCLPPCFPDNP